MRTARLPTVRVSVAETGRQYRLVGGRFYVQGGGMGTHPLPQVSCLDPSPGHAHPQRWVFTPGHINPRIYSTHSGIPTQTRIKASCENITFLELLLWAIIIVNRTPTFRIQFCYGSVWGPEQGFTGNVAPQKEVSFESGTFIDRINLWCGAILDFVTFYSETGMISNQLVFSGI